MRKNQYIESHRLLQEWGHAVERASADKRTDLALDPAVLNDAAGLHVQSGVQGGAWTHTCSCVDSCGCPE